MIVAAVVEMLIGIDAERRSLESVAAPLSSEEGGSGGMRN
jgi:hypothetical protein